MCRTQSSPGLIPRVSFGRKRHSYRFSYLENHTESLAQTIVETDVDIQSIILLGPINNPTQAKPYKSYQDFKSLPIPKDNWRVPSEPLDCNETCSRPYACTVRPFEPRGSGRQEMFWNSFAYHLAKVLSVFWFAGAFLMLITIPACMYKLFSALWEADDAEQEQSVTEKYGTSRIT